MTERYPLEPDEIADLKDELAAANRIIAEQSTAIATAHSALLAGYVDHALEVLAGKGGQS
jgi:hypothetical protein